MWRRTWTAIKAAFTFDSFTGGIIWWGLPLVVLWLLSKLLQAPALSLLSYILLATFFFVVAMRARREGRWPFGGRGVPGWMTRVMLFRRRGEEEDPAKELMIQLFGPGGQRANGVVTCELEVDGHDTYRPEPDKVVFNDYHLQPEELPHYFVFFPQSFDDSVERRNGRYVVRWFETYGLDSRQLTRAKPFTIRNGVFVGAKRLPIITGEQR